MTATEPRPQSHRWRGQPGLLRNLVTFALVAALGIVSVGIILSRQRISWPWEHTFTFAATFTETAGISPGNGQEVRIAGVPVGEITEAHVDRQGHAVVEMRMEAGHPIYDNAHLVMRPKSPLNEIFINVNPGGPPGRPLAADAVLPLSSTSKAVQVDEVLAHLDDNTRAALGNLLTESDIALADAPRDLPAGLRATDRVLTDLAPVATELDTRRATIAKLVSALSQVSTAAGRDDARLASLADSLNQTLHSVAAQNSALDSSLGRLPGLSTALRGATDSVTDLATQLDPTLDDVRAASDKLPGALDDLTDSVDQLGDTVDAARPFADRARPVFADLRPFAGHLRDAAADLAPITGDLGPVTGRLLPYLPDLQAFIYNTNSMVSLHDVNKGILRGQFTVGPTSLPLPLGGLSTPTPGGSR
jgi:phospholipid/cholesterol/gamma-HCH transport system substrate-binding protein